MSLENTISITDDYPIPTSDWGYVIRCPVTEQLCGFIDSEVVALTVKKLWESYTGIEMEIHYSLKRKLHKSELMEMDSYEQQIRMEEYPGTLH
jgi:hypothetical protein